MNDKGQKLKSMSNEQLIKFGWWLFFVSALLFGWSALRARDWIAAAGAGAFMIANICFMIAIYRDNGGRLVRAVSARRSSPRSRP